MAQLTKKIQEIQKDEVFTIPEQEGEYCRKGMVYSKTYSYYVAADIAALVLPKFLNEDTIVIPTGQYFNTDPSFPETKETEYKQ
jgi:hypothetical protein